MYLNRTLQYNIILCACAAASLACLFRGRVCFFARKETITATFEARIAHMCVRVSWRQSGAPLNNNNIIILCIMFIIIAFECIIIRLKRINHYVYIIVIITYSVIHHYQTAALSRIPRKRLNFHNMTCGVKYTRDVFN